MTEIARPDRFRILIIGRANAGKTTILRAVCGAKGEPDVYDQDGKKITPGAGSKARLALRSIRTRLLHGSPNSVHAPNPQAVPNQGPPLQLADAILSPSSLRGEHNIEYSLKFPTSPGFVFHDSRGFESGAIDELEYCFSTDSNRFMTAADKEFFNTIDTGTVPVIAIFTKFDALDATAFSTLSEQGVPFAEAQRQAPEHAQAKFDQDLLPLIQQLAHPPRAVVCLRNMHNKGSPATIQKAAADLIESTGSALDDGALKGPDAEAFINQITPLITPSLHSMSPPLQILVVGCAAVIIAAKSFWKHPGDTRVPHITASAKDYIQSNTAEHVRVAILEAFQDTPGLYDTPEGKAALLQVILNNQLSIEDIED
ncbi:hypothetical protein BOTBODRAFT_174437 [Botryobasidium botryosum FD-172 SS1]|uniref:G domain-containing protein n=1 Tax=Botryobasidium botryosum (strain FD-172 SS1) TaxID=930990 RepID=A0A067MSV7_BOTB1|nr:hypothetical protein BOTBODRAFT_174437 [Botryobasidium botryosum FD-172 SS1]